MSYDFDSICAPSFGKLEEAALNDDDGADSFFDAPEAERTLGDEDFKTPRKTLPTHARESDIDGDDTLVEMKTPQSTVRSTRKSTRRVRIALTVEQIECSPASPVHSPKSPRRKVNFKENDDPEIRKSAGRTPKKTPKVIEEEEDLETWKSAGRTPKRTPNMTVDEDELEIRKSAGRTPKKSPAMVVEEEEEPEDTEAPKRMSMIVEEEEEEEIRLVKTPKKTPRKSMKHVSFDGILIQPTPEKTHAMVTRQDVRLKTPTLELRGRKVTKRTLEPEAPSKGLTLAEKIYHFQNDTPERFHVWKNVQRDQEAPQIKITVPHSPALITKTRARPTLIPSWEEREEQIMEEMRKQQVKAHPVSERVLHPQAPPKPAPRPSTVLEPFHLTEVGKKKIIEEEKPFQFKAKPMPAKVYQEIRKTSVNPLEKMDKIIKKKRQLGTYTRSLEMLRKKEEKIAQFREEQGKIKPFQATPLPKFLSSSRDSIVSSCSSLNRSHHQHCLDTQLSPQRKRFRASIPSVLYRKPFEPQKTEKTFTEVTNVVLNTEKRARLRDKYNRKVQENKELTDKEKEEMGEIEQQFEAESLARYRASLVHKPIPVPIYPDADVTLNRTTSVRLSRL